MAQGGSVSRRLNGSLYRLGVSVQASFVIHSLGGTEDGGGEGVGFYPLLNLPLQVGIVLLRTGLGDREKSVFFHLSLDLHHHLHLLC